MVATATRRRPLQDALEIGRNPSGSEPADPRRQRDVAVEIAGHADDARGNGADEHHVTGSGPGCRRASSSRYGCRGRGTLCDDDRQMPGSQASTSTRQSAP